MQSATVTVRRGFGQTRRRDVWWATPLAVFIGLGAFVVYATWAAFQNAHYSFGPYLSPFYSPEIFGDSPHAWFGPKPGWWPGLAALFAGAADPAVPGSLPVHLLLLPRRLLQVVLGGSRRRARSASRGRSIAASIRFRSSCRTSTATSCAWRSCSSSFLAYDVWMAMWFTNPATGAKEFGIGVGTHRPGRQRRVARLLHVGLPRRCVTWSAAARTRCRSLPRATSL